MIIQSTQNPKIKHLEQLQRKSYRQKHQEFIAQGFKTCKTLLDASFTIKSIYMTEPMYLKHQNDFLIEDTYVVSDEIMQKISTTTTATGIVAIFAMKNSEFVATANAAAFVGIQDPGNLGTMIRSAAAMGLAAVYLVDSVELYNPKVIQATTGSLNNINIITCSWSFFEKNIGSIPLCALVVHDGKNPQEIDLAKHILIIGNEGQGLSEEIIKKSSNKMTIPMKGNTESLNAAVAASIGMYLKSQIK